MSNLFHGAISLDGRKLAILAVAYMMLILSVSSIQASDTSLPGSILMGISPSFQSLLHIPEYALLSGLCFFNVLNLGMEGRRAGVVVSCFCLAFAAIDECYQQFVPGRFMSLGDWVYDAVGVFAGYMGVKRKTWSVKREK